MFKQWLLARILRMKTRWSRRRLDEQLAQGADPTTSAELSLRAEQLAAHETRERFASALASVLDEAIEPMTFTLRLRPHRAEIRAAADDLLALGARLREERPTEVQGLALTALLLTRGASPLDPNSGASLRRAVRSARFALEPTDVHDLERAAAQTNDGDVLAA
jgi:hypothetical protein